MARINASNPSIAERLRSVWRDASALGRVGSIGAVLVVALVLIALIPFLGRLLLAVALAALLFWGIQWVLTRP